MLYYLIVCSNLRDFGKYYYHQILCMLLLVVQEETSCKLANVIVCYTRFLDLFCLCAWNPA